MKNTIFRMILALLLLSLFHKGSSFDCYAKLQEKEVTYMNWSSLRVCLSDLGDHFISEEISRNIWILIKMAFNGLENIPPTVYKTLGRVLTVIPINELQKIRMAQVEIVEAFGAIGMTDSTVGNQSDKQNRTMAVFQREQMYIIAHKIRQEWLGKVPKTYSEYDLMLLGNIICYLNVSDINEIHGDAFRLAAEKIGRIQNCPQESLQAFAALAKLENAFGHPSGWSKLDLSIIGNVINGLSQEDIDRIDENKLFINHYFIAGNRIVSESN